MVVHQCERCRQCFASSDRLKTHIARKNPCLRVEIPLKEAIEEHKRLNKVLVSATDNVKGVEAHELDKEIGTQQKELKHYEDLDKIKYSKKIDLKLDKNTGNSCVLLASSKAGKSVVLMYLYKRYYKDTVAVLFTENPHIKVYDVSKKLIIARSFYPDVVRAAHSVNRRTDNEYEFTFMTDDIVNVKESLVLKKMILTLRNSKISSLVSLQAPTLLSKQNRGSVNNYLFGKFNTDEMIQQVITMFLLSHLSGTMEQKIHLYKRMTDNHGFILYNPRDDSISLHRLAL